MRLRMSSWSDSVESPRLFGLRQLS